MNALHLPFLSMLLQFPKQTSVMPGSCLNPPSYCSARTCWEDSQCKSIHGLGERLLAPTPPCRSCKSNWGGGMYMSLSGFAGTKSVSPFYKICLSPNALTHGHLRHFCQLGGAIPIPPLLPKSLMGSFGPFGDFIQNTRHNLGRICPLSSGEMIPTDQAHQSQHH